MSETIKNKDAISLYESDMAKYSIAVNRRRALPMINDGLKPVQRRIVFDAYRLGLYNGKNDKSATLVGHIIGYLHPHGDASAYDAIVCLANWFRIKYPLMSECGTNYGNVSTAVPASMRYTHAGLADFGYEVLAEDLNKSKNVVDWIDTYKRNEDKEPEFLPAKLPLLLINGSFGIGLGMTISVPSHNIVEVIEVTRALLKNPNTKFCLIPDLCQACDIIEADWQTINNTGVGKFKVRGKIDTIIDKKGNVELHIRSLPEGVSTRQIYDKILDMIDNKQLPFIKDIYNVLDNNDRPDITIHLKPGVDADYVKNIIWAKTQVMGSQTVNFEAVTADGMNTKRFNYREYLLTFIDYRMNTKFRLYCNLMQQAMTRHHYIDAFIKVLESGELETIIQMIRKQKATDETPIIEYIIKHCHTTDIQAKFIISTQISRLTLAHLKSFKEERTKLDKAISEYKAKVTDDGTLIRKEIDQELLELEKKYGTPRLCRVISAAEENNIPAGMFKIVVTEKNFIRKVPDTDKVNIVRKDNPKFIIRIDNTENLLLFDNKGKVFPLAVHKIPITDKSGAGTDVRMLIKNLTADIINVFPENMLKAIAKSGNKHYLTVLTRNNYIKKLDLEDFTSITPSGLVYSKISPDDEVVSLQIIGHGLDIIVSTGYKAARYPLKDVSLLKRNAIGVGAMNTTEPIVGMAVMYPDNTNIIAITKNGKFNRFNAAMFTAHRRNQKGVNLLKLDNNDTINFVLAANDNDIIRVVTEDGIENIPVNSIANKSTIAAGVRYTQSKSKILRADVIKQQ